MIIRTISIANIQFSIDQKEQSKPSVSKALTHTTRNLLESHPLVFHTVIIGDNVAVFALAAGLMCIDGSRVSGVRAQHSTRCKIPGEMPELMRQEHDALLIII